MHSLLESAVEDKGISKMRLKAVMLHRNALRNNDKYLRSMCFHTRFYIDSLNDYTKRMDHNRSAEKTYHSMFIIKYITSNMYFKQIKKCYCNEFQLNFVALDQK